MRPTQHAQTPLLLILAVATIPGLAACGSNSNGAPPASMDAGTDSTTQPDGGVDTGAGNTDSGAETAPPPTGDAGEPCTPPGTCAPGLFCNPQGTCQASYCGGKPQKPLPYAVASDFQTVFTIGPEKDNLALIPSGADCDSMTYPPIPNTGLADAGTDAAVDAAGATADAAADAAVDAATDGAVDGSGPSYPTLNDGGAEIVTYSSTPSCYEFLFDPSCLTGTQGLCWAGAEFTNSAATAAAAPDGHVSANAIGVCLASGATVITFEARASVAGTIVKFGSNRPGACSALIPIKEADGGIPDPATEQSACPGATEFYLGLTTSWQQYTISLPPGEPYNDEPGAGGGVWNAFSLVVEPEYFVGGAYVFVKNIVWGNPTVGYDAGAVSPDAGGSSDASGSSEAGGSDAGSGDAEVSDAPPG
jgi:hypothetical protein